MWNSARRAENIRTTLRASLPAAHLMSVLAIRQCCECTANRSLYTEKYESCGLISPQPGHRVDFSRTFALRYGRCCFSQRIHTAANGSIAHEIECRTVELLTLTTGRGRPSPKTNEDKALRGSSCKARAGVSSSGDRHRPRHVSKRLHARENASISGSAEHGS